MMKARRMGILIRSLNEAGAIVSASNSHQIRSGLVVLEQGKEVGKHETGGGEELIVLLQGTGELQSDGETKTIHAPAAVLVPAHTAHNVRNSSKVPLRYVYVYVVAMDGQ
jgi:quercetin dioxygenase-like cupin family protein